MKNTKSRVSRISIGRVYNLGNYEHVRYEVTVDIPAGASAAKTIIGLERIIAGLRPDRSIKTPRELSMQQADIERMQKMTAEEWDRNYSHYTGTRKEIISRLIADLKTSKKRREVSLKRQTRARQLFDNVAGSAKWRDAKLDWEDEQD